MLTRKACNLILISFCCRISELDASTPKVPSRKSFFGRLGASADSSENPKVLDEDITGEDETEKFGKDESTSEKNIETLDKGKSPPEDVVTVSKGRFPFFNRKKNTNDELNPDVEVEGKNITIEEEDTSLEEDDTSLEEDTVVPEDKKNEMNGVEQDKPLKDNLEMERSGNRGFRFFNRKRNSKEDGKNEEKNPAPGLDVYEIRTSSRTDNDEVVITDDGKLQSEQNKRIIEEIKSSDLKEKTNETEGISDEEQNDKSSFTREIEELLETYDENEIAMNSTDEKEKDSITSNREEKEETKRNKIVRQAFKNAFPWFRKNESDEEEPLEKEGPSGQSNSTCETDVKPGDRPMPIGAPNPPIILFSSPPSLPRTPAGLQMPPSRRMPQSPKDATIVGLVNALLPLLSRLILLPLLSGSSLFGKNENIYSPEPSQHFMLERVNERYQKDSMALKKALENPPEDVSKQRWSFARKKRNSVLKKQFELEDKVAGKTSIQKPLDRYFRTVIVLEVQTLNNDMDSVVEELRDSISFILAQYHDKMKRLDMGDQLEVIVCVESPGGVVQDFGLAADQLKRLRDAGSTRNDLTLTVCVDKIAASGGYMMACQASPGQLMAAPFAVLGSIGVLRETINVHDVLEKYGVRPLLLKAGNAKVPLTQTTKVTEESIALVQKNLDRVHEAFRELVSNSRGDSISRNFDDVTNGDIFLGKHAAEFGLVDSLMTSDEYIAGKIQAGDRVLRLHKYDRSRVGLRLSPIDLLFLKGNGLMGKNFTSFLRKSMRVISKVMSVGAAMGMMKVLDKSFQMSSSRRPEDNI